MQLYPKALVDKDRITIVDEHGASFCMKQGVQTRPISSIPKSLHFIWLDTPIPIWAYWCINTWKYCHPDWKVFLWTNQKVNSNELRSGVLCTDLSDVVFNHNKYLYDKANCPAYKSDILRLEIIQAYGGVYVDCDVCCLKAIDDLCCGTAAFTSIAGEHLNNAIFGASAGHVWLDLMLRRAIDYIEYLPGPRLMTQFTQYCPEVCIYDEMFFSPIKPENELMIKKACSDFVKHSDLLDDFRQFSYAVHFWNFSWNKEINNGDGRVSNWCVRPI